MAGFQLMLLCCAAAVIKQGCGQMSSHDYSTPFRNSIDDLYSRMWQLQALTGPLPKYRLKYFRNYGSTFTSNVFLVQPRTLREIQKVIRAAAKMPGHMHIRAVGGALSWSPMFSDDDSIMMDIRGVNGPDGKRFWIKYEKDNVTPHSVKVMGGVSLGEMIENMVGSNVEISPGSFPILRNPTVAGVVSVASHSSSWTEPGSSGLVTAMSIVDSSGNLRHFTTEEHPQEMRALRCCVGMCGIIYDVTFRASPQRVYEVKTYLPTYRQLAQNDTVRRMIQKATQPMAWGFTLNSLKDNKTEEWDLFDDIINLRVVSKALPAGSSVNPKDATVFAAGTTQEDWMRLLRGEVSYNATVNHWQGSHKGSMYLPRAMSPLVVGKRPSSGSMSTAFYFPEKKDFSMLKKVLNVYRQEHNRATKDGTMPASNIVGVRWLGRADCYLCPEDGRDHNLVLDIVAAPPTSAYQYQRFISKLNRKFRRFGVRLHWGKLQLFKNAWQRRRHFKNAYGKNMRNFIKVRRSARFDPENMFVNEYLRDIFFYKGHW